MQQTLCPVCVDYATIKKRFYKLHLLRVAGRARAVIPYRCEVHERMKGIVTIDPQMVAGQIDSVASRGILHVIGVISYVLPNFVWHIRSSGKRCTRNISSAHPAKVTEKRRLGRQFGSDVSQARWAKPTVSTLVVFRT
jgi:hypothetical protein